jgi:uncharacterized protein
MKVIVDTNVLLSGALRDRLPERVLMHIATRDEIKRLVTPQILAEYLSVLARPKFKLTIETLKQWGELLVMRTVDIGAPPMSPDFPRDPKDAPFLAAALFSGADWLITGDQDLLSAPPIPPTKIGTVAQFASEFQIV